MAIVPPSKNLNLNINQYPEHIYANRKGYHSINVQLVGEKIIILNINIYLRTSIKIKAEIHGHFNTPIFNFYFMK